MPALNQYMNQFFYSYGGNQQAGTIESLLPHMREAIVLLAYCLRAVRAR